MNAGREARHGYDEKNETKDGITAGHPDPSGTEQRIGAPPLTAVEADGVGALPAPSGIIYLCVIAGRHQRAADPVQLTRALGFDPTAPITDAQLVLAAKELGLKARSVRPRWEGLPRRSLPVIAELNSGEFVVLLRSDPDGQVLVGDPHKPRPERENIAIQFPGASMSCQVLMLCRAHRGSSPGDRAAAGRQSAWSNRTTARKRRPKPYPWLKVPRAKARRQVRLYGSLPNPSS